MINDFVNFLNESPVAYGATKSIVETLKKNGYEEFRNQQIEKGKKYYVSKNNTCVIAFNVGKDLSDPSLHLVASHTDCPCLKLKPQPIHKGKNAIQLNIEPYGGMLMRTWIDRPLSLAGRVMVDEGDRISTKILIDKKPFCIIPSMAIHLNHESDSKPLSIPADVTPLVTMNREFDFNEYIASKIGADKDSILSFDLFLHTTENAYLWGVSDEFVSSSQMDNLQSVYVSLQGFINSFNDNNINVFAAFDNEEVGSTTRQGANSDLLKNLLKRICKNVGINYYWLINQGMMVSFDSAQAAHPNHPEMYDGDNVPELNKGICVKFNASQSYTTDSISYAIFTKLLKRNNIPYQVYANKTGVRGGSTLGGISNSHIPLISIDVGLPLLSMHSCMETGGAYDVESSVEAVKRFYEAHLQVDPDTNYSI